MESSKKGRKFFIFAGKKCIRMAVLLFLVSAATFWLVSISPLDPLSANIGQAALGSMSQEQIAKLQEYWGVGTPPVKRFLSWFGDLLCGDWGMSLLYRRPVMEVIQTKLANSLWLMAAAWLLSGLVGFLLGIAAGFRRGSAADRIISGYALVTASTPSFWLALVFLMVFAVWLKWLPIGLSVPIGVETAGVTIQDRLVHAVLPVLTLSVTGISNIALHTREKMIQVMESDYVMFARARGESDFRILVQHGVRNILLPAMTLQFASISEIFGGSVLVEQVFSYPGLGQAAVTAGLGGDVPLLLGITLISAVIVFAGNLAADLLYAAVDPRMAEKNKEAAGKEGHEENEKKQCIIRKPEAAYDDSVCGLSAAFGGHSPGGLVLAGGSFGGGFFQKKSGSLPSISLWDRLDGAGYVCKNNSRPVFKYPPRGGNGGNQLAYSPGPGTGRSGSWKGSRQRDWRTD